MIRVNVGCGQTPTEGWQNFDNSMSIRLAKVPLLVSLLAKLRLLKRSQLEFIEFIRGNAIEYADGAEKLPFATGSVDVVYSSHMLEHLDREEARGFLREARRVLKPGGIIRLAVPDLRGQVQGYLESNDADAFIAGTHLTQERPRTLAKRLRILFVGTRHHQWMYDGASLSRLLISEGFENASVVPAGASRIPDPGNLDLSERKDESVYVEAENP